MKIKQKINQIFNKFKAQSTRAKLILLFTIFLSVFLLYFLISNKSNNTDGSVVAVVNGEDITYQSLEANVSSRVKFFEQKDQSFDKSIVESESLNNLIDNKLLEQYAVKENVFVENADVEQIYNARVNQLGSEDALLKEINILYGIDKNTYISSLYYDVLREKVQNHSGKALKELLDQLKKDSEITINNN